MTSASLSKSLTSLGLSFSIPTIKQGTKIFRGSSFPVRLTANSLQPLPPRPPPAPLTPCTRAAPDSVGPPPLCPFPSGLVPSGSRVHLWTSAPLLENLLPTRQRQKYHRSARPLAPDRTKPDPFAEPPVAPRCLLWSVCVPISLSAGLDSQGRGRGRQLRGWRLEKMKGREEEGSEEGKERDKKGGKERNNSPQCPFDLMT